MAETALADAAGHFARVEAVLDGALDQSASAREHFVRQACGDDQLLRREALGLLAAMTHSEGFLEHDIPARDGAPGQGTQLGPWTLQELLGSGGSGDVWLGARHDGQFDQRVAVKLLRHWHRDDVPRFLREQRLLAQLDHTNIARLLDAGSTLDGQPYMVMEFVAGEAVTVYARGQSLNIDARLGLFLQVCDAVAYAHRHLIVHRDIKPQNILVRNDGRVILLDFGIAQVLDEAATATTRSQYLTPQYAAPEQLAGQAETTSTDVYALGLLLHELLVGQPPWGRLLRQGTLALLQRVAVGPLPLPSAQAVGDDAKRLRGDLDAIVHKATQAEPDARYASVEALKQDIDHFQAMRPVQARGRAIGYWIRRALRRHWLVAATLSLFVSGLLIALIAVILAQHDAARDRDIAQTEAARSKAVRDYLAHMFRDAGLHTQAGKPLTAKQVLEQAAGRVDAGFAQDPAAAADVLKALGELHFYIGDYAAADPLLQRWLAHESAIADETAAADVRFTLAETVHRMGRSDEATQLLAQAQKVWLQDPARHADVLLTSRMLQSQLERQRGEVQAGIATLEAALPQRLQRSGPEHFETGVLFSNLGAAYIQAGRFDEGIESSQEAMRIWTVLHMERSNDALNTLNNLAAAHFRQGQLAEAEAAFASALALRREAYGPSAATAALIGNYARTLLKTGKAAQAVQLAEEAAAMAETHAGDTSPLTISVRVTLAEGLFLLQRFDDVASVLDLLAAVDTATMPVSLDLRAQVMLGKLHHQRGDAKAARAAHDRARAAMDTLGPAAEPMRADVEALRGRIQASQGSDINP